MAMDEQTFKRLKEEGERLRRTLVRHEAQRKAGTRKVEKPINTSKETNGQLDFFIDPDDLGF